MTTPRPVSALEVPSKIKQPSAAEVNANIKIEWHDVLGPPYPARWEGKMPPTTSESCCCPCCPDEDNDIITRHRLQTRPEYSRGKRNYDDFYGAPIPHGKYTHDFDGRQPKRPAGIRNMVQEQQQQTQQPQQQQQMAMMQQQQQQQQMMMQQQQQQRMMMMNPQALGGQQQQYPSAMPVASTANNNNGMEQEMQPVFSPEKASDGSHPSSDANSNDQRVQQETTETTNAAPQGEPVKRISSEPMVSPNTETRQNAAAAAANKQGINNINTANQQQQQQPQQQTQQQQEQVLHGFAKYIGIDVENEPHLLPLAQQCLAAPPPPPWQPVRDPNSGRTYYANAQTKQTTWDHPLLPTFRERVVQWRQHYAQQQVQQASASSSVRKDEGQQKQNEQQQQEQQEQERPRSNPLSKEGATREVENEDVVSEDPHRVKDS